MTRSVLPAHHHELLQSPMHAATLAVELMQGTHAQARAGKLLVWTSSPPENPRKPAVKSRAAESAPFEMYRMVCNLLTPCSLFDSVVVQTNSPPVRGSVLVQLCTAPDIFVRPLH